MQPDIPHSTNNILLAPIDEREEALLVEELRARGVFYLTGSLSASERTRDHLTTPALLQRLMRCSNARVRDATISLLLLHPEVTDDVCKTLACSTAIEREQLITLTLATLYLQQFWWYRLTLALGHSPTLSEEPFTDLWRTRHLPPPVAYCGHWGLLALERYEQQHYGLPLAFLGDWQNQLKHLLSQEETRHHSTTPLHLHHCQENHPHCDTIALDEKEIDMSMRPRVDRQTIEHFLMELGRRFHHAGRLYLVGGAALVHAGIRPGASATTQDIDVEVADGDMYQIINQLKQLLQINVEFASPGDFIPLPKNWQSLSRFVGRYGSIDVFYFDFYSSALSKIDRGTTRDLQDVALLLQKQIITLPELDAAVQEVATQMGKGAYKRLDAQAFLARYHAIRPYLQNP